MYEVQQVAVCEELDIADAPSISDQYRQIIQSGAGRSDWGFVLRRAGVAIGRVCFRLDETCPAEFLGRLPARELFPVGLWLPWNEPDVVGAGKFLFEHAFAGLRDAVSEPLQAVVNIREEHATQCRAVYEAWGMELFQEKQGFGFRSGDPVPSAPAEITMLPLATVGIERFRDVLGRAGAATLDRNDRWYRELAGPHNWAGVFMSMHEPSEPNAWLLAVDAQGRELGVVAVSRFSGSIATVTFIGVVPECRGHGYSDALLRAGHAAALSAGFDAMLSDVDVHNTPMTSAFLRNGHRPDAWPWHKWHYRMPT